MTTVLDSEHCIFHLNLPTFLDSAVVTIFIRDQNDNQPLITLDDGEFTIEENREAGAEIQGPKIEISDIDRDEFSNGRWFLLVKEVGDNPCPGQFSIFP